MTKINYEGLAQADMIDWCVKHYPKNKGDVYSAMRAMWKIMTPEERASWSMARIYRESEKLGIC